MDKFKDFLYNKNDIIIALLILMLAAAIIYNRVDAIMNYDLSDIETESSLIEAVRQFAQSFLAGLIRQGGRHGSHHIYGNVRQGPQQGLCHRRFQR